MPRGDKSSYTGKQKRNARHIEKGYEKSWCVKERSAATRPDDGEQAIRQRKEIRLGS